MAGLVAVGGISSLSTVYGPAGFGACARRVWPLAPHTTIPQRPEISWNTPCQRFSFGSYTAPPPQALQLEFKEWKPEGVNSGGEINLSELQLEPPQAVSQTHFLFVQRPLSWQSMPLSQSALPSVVLSGALRRLSELLRT